MLICFFIGCRVGHNRTSPDFNHPVVLAFRASNQAESGGLKNDEPEQNGFRRLASGLYARDFHEIGRAYVLC
ncbi:hypothetical protein DAPPUDRAFT_238241 [Daphnia pulex]|uniref:Uncharacterized protein n=1 Tax=Daphnia pulex TaxID=6669 RepID=E9G5W3_DAPPU|nr:hypothetical protein DAPPUDRAFT_238241 [Daphnia pulex]|eukprot:EFX84835.1 hypothetical protein DAPPUDRAFT_238241 [Daphnia pulex]